MEEITAGEHGTESTAQRPRERDGCRRTPGRNLRLGVVEAAGPERDELERFVSAAFLRKHLRGADGRALYLEQYLDQPVEAAIAAATGHSVERSHVVEVGNLAGANCRTAVRMVALLPGQLMAGGYRWIVFTATSAVREILLGFGAPLVELARAEGARIATGADDWGRYYESDPRVFAGFLPDSRRVPGFSASEHDH